MRKPNNSQKKVIADYVSHVSTIFIAVAITPLFSQFNEYNFWGVGLGLLLSIACLSLSLFLLRRSH